MKLLILLILLSTLYLCVESLKSERHNIGLIVSDIYRLPENRFLEEYNIHDGEKVIETIHSDFLLIYVNKSTIENGGNGVFAKILIPNNSIICEYRGPVVKNSDQPKLPYNDKYFGIDFAGKKYSIIGENVCSIINDCSNSIEMLKQNNTLLNENDDPSQCYENLSYNSVALAMGSKIFIVSNRDILPNEEIFFSYQWEYWKKQFLQH